MVPGRWVWLPPGTYSTKVRFDVYDVGSVPDQIELVPGEESILEIRQAHYTRDAEVGFEFGGEVLGPWYYSLNAQRHQSGGLPRTLRDRDPILLRYCPAGDYTLWYDVPGLAAGEMTFTLPDNDEPVPKQMIELVR